MSTTHEGPPAPDHVIYLHIALGKIGVDAGPEDFIWQEMPDGEPGEGVWLLRSEVTEPSPSSTPITR